MLYARTAIWKHAEHGHAAQPHRWPAEGRWVMLAALQADARQHCIVQYIQDWHAYRLIAKQPPWASALPGRLLQRQVASVGGH